MKSIRKTKITATIGPKSESEEVFTQLVRNGLSVARINFSHGGYEDNKEKIEMIKRVRRNEKKPVALLLDTKRPEIRTGMLESGDEKIEIIEGQKFTFVNDDIIGNNEKASVSYKELYKDVKPGDHLLVDDGALEFRIDSINGKDIETTALNTAKLGSRKTMNVPGAKIELPALTKKDIDDITNGVKAGIDYIAASFVRKASDVIAIRELLSSIGGEKVKIISKIENQEGIDNFDEILDLSDGIMVARGDMGVEIPMENVPIVQKIMIKKCNEAGKPVITATQMLESMQSNPRPTRAEVSDVANAVFDLTGAIMLSGETAAGKFPVECVRVMDKIAKKTEESINYWKRFENRKTTYEAQDLEGNISYIACSTAHHLNADGIVAYTHKGDSIRKLSGLAPYCPIYAVADDEKTYNQLALVRGVTPILVVGDMSIEEKIKQGIDILKSEDYLQKGDLVVLAGGSKILPVSGENKVIGGFVRI